MHRAALTIALLLVFGRPLAAQTSPTYDRHSLLWLAYAGDHAIANGLALLIDVQERRVEFGGEQQQFLARTGLLASVGPGVRAGGGYAFSSTADYGEFTPEGTQLEHRLWQQLSLSHASHRVAFTHRFRLEQRWTGVESTDDPETREWTFQWRGRYQFRAALPLHESAGRRGYVYGFGADEVFVKWGASQTTNLFDQNRFQLGLGVELARHLRLEASWLNVQQLRGDGSQREDSNGLALTLVSDAPFR